MFVKVRRRLGRPSGGISRHGLRAVAGLAHRQWTKLTHWRREWPSP